MAANAFEGSLSDREFEHDWTIRDWWTLVQNKSRLAETTTEIQCHENNLEYAKFIIGFNFFPIYNNEEVKFCWKLIHKHHLLHKIEANIVIGIKQNDDEGRYSTYESRATAEVGQVINMDEHVWRLSAGWGSSLVKLLTNSVGSMKLNIKIKLFNMPDPECLLKAFELRNSSKDEYSQNLLALLDHKSSTDVKILTKDNILLLAHKLILSARCSTFATMFESSFLENSTGLVKVDDISGKTMEILLKYWYSGELLPSWKDGDVIVELLYAAGKYQMTNLLNIMDGDYSGLDFQPSEGDVELLKLVHNLSLENAEARILKRIIKKVSQATKSTEILDLFSLSSDEVDEKCVATFKTLKTFDDALSKKDNNRACFYDVKLMMLACKFEMKNVEIRLLNRIIGTATNIGSTTELFALFGVKHESNNPVNKEGNVLLDPKPINTHEIQQVTG